MKRWLNILIVAYILLTASALKAQDNPVPESQKPEESFDKDELIKEIYEDFLNIQVLDKRFTMVYFVRSGDVEKIGIDEEELTDYFKLRIKNNFANINIEVPDYNKFSRSQVGYIHLRVWVAGDNSPLAVHLKCSFFHSDYSQAGSPQMWDNEMLGLGSKDDILDIIKRNIDKMIEELAILFFKVRGEL